MSIVATLRLNGELLCTSGTTYGTNNNPKTNARNEKNHLIAIASCYNTAIYTEKCLRFQRSDVFTIESVYNSSINDIRFSTTLVAGEHKNVMSDFNMGVVFEGDSSWVTEKRTSASLENNFVPVEGL